MAADHEKIARADTRRFVFTACPVERAKLTNLIVIPDFEVAALTAELKVLGLTADDRMLENPVSGSEFRIPLDDRISPNLAIWADFHVIFDDCCRMDRHLQGFEHNRVLWILQILFIMHDCLWFEPLFCKPEEPKSLCLVISFAVASRKKVSCRA